MSDAPTLACPNCAAPRAGRYCVRCGQDNRHPRLRLGALLDDLIDALFNVDGRIARTVRELTLDPGGLVRRYTSGQRVRYVNPLRYAIVTCALWWIAVQWATHDLAADALSERTRVTLRYGQLMNLLALPLLALPLWLAFAGGRFGYLQHLCLTLFACGHVFLWRAVLAAAGRWLKAWAPALAYADSIALVLYLGATVYFCFRGRVRHVLVRSVLAITAFTAISVVLAEIALRRLSA